MKGKKELPTGTAFLYGIASKDELFRMHKSEKDAKAAIRLLAYHMRKCGASIYDIAEKLSRPYGTVRYWLVRAHKHGLEGRFDIKHGAPCRLDKKQLERLRADLIKGPDNCGFKATTWTGPLVIAHVKKKFGITYAETSMYDLLHRIGFSCRKPRPKHPKSASESEKKEFKKKARQSAKYYSKKGYTVMIGDESMFILGWNVKNSWYPVGEPVYTPVSLSRKRFYVIGALSRNRFDYRFYEKANTGTFYKFLRTLRRKYGKVLLFVDNASYHKSAELNRKMAKWNGDVVLKYLPPYAPELNNSEGQWRGFKKATSNCLYKTVKEMQRSLRSMTRRGEIKVVKMNK